MIAFKVVKLAVFLLFISSCSEADPARSEKPDTIKVDTIPNNAPEDSVIYRNDEDEDQKEKEEMEENNSVIQQEV